MGLLRKHNQDPSHYNKNRHARVLQDISNILNTKKGYGSFDPDFGIEDISHYTDRAMICGFIKGEIIRNLTSYYPQIEVVKITDSPSTMTARIQMTLEVKVRGEPLRISVYNEKGLERWIVAP